MCDSCYGDSTNRPARCESWHAGSEWIVSKNNGDFIANKLCFSDVSNLAYMPNWRNANKISQSSFKIL